MSTEDGKVTPEAMIRIERRHAKATTDLDQAWMDWEERVGDLRAIVQARESSHRIDIQWLCQAAKFLIQNIEVRRHSRIIDEIHTRGLIKPADGDILE